MRNRALTTAASTPQPSESSYLEPGLLAVFRLAVQLQIAVQLVSIAFGALFETGLVWEAFAAIALGGYLLTLGYLSWPKLWHTLGRIFLPVALLLVTVVPLLERALYAYFQMKQPLLALTPQDLFSVDWRLIVGFFVPLVLMAWQYTFRTVLAFIGLFFVLSQALGVWLYGKQFYQMREPIELTLILTITFVIISYIITRMMRIQRQQFQALIDANAQLVAANLKLADYAATTEELAISRERNRMARDLHDTLAHTLTAVAVQLEAADSIWEQALDQAHSMVVKALGTARSGLAETRRAIQALRAAPLDDLGLTLAIRTLAESTAARSGARLEAHLAEDIKLPAVIEQTIYRITQETLDNVATHANAQTIWVTLGIFNQQVRLVIADDGVGFASDQAAPDGHYGLQGLHEQAQLIGAQLEIESQPQHGTIIRLTLAKRQ
ncbi:MAG: sensor histidine kinase [Chloroflexi bacterium]|nr:sensor histidine kinase [Chloroflexota bacterium]